MRQGMVYMNGIPAGVLTEVSPTEYLFRYEDAYYADAAMPAVSLTLPKTQQEYWSPYLSRFSAICSLKDAIAPCSPGCCISTRTTISAFCWQRRRPMSPEP